MIESAEVAGDVVTVQIDGRSATFTARWLRDHSEDPASLDASTLQREVDTFAIPADLAPTGVALVGHALHISWPGDVPDSICTEALLAGVTAATPDRRVAWPDGPAMHGDRHDAGALVEDDGLAALLADLEIWGVGLIGGMEATEEAASALAERIGRIRTTVFGGMWKLESSLTDHQDSAYSTTYLEPHTDSTYLVDAPGSQLFSCVRRTGTGGESILVDGLAVAETMRDQSPDAFATLTAVEVPGRYVEPGVHLAASRPAMRLGRDGRLEQLSFNNYDRAPFWLPEPTMSEFYNAYAELHELVIDRSRWLEVRLEPGDALIFDNWRVLHGRRAYTGDRTFLGCYHDREELDSRRRVLASSSF